MILCKYLQGVIKGYRIVPLYAMNCVACTSWPVVFPTDSSGQLTPLSLVVYKFDGVPEHVVLMAMPNLINRTEGQKRVQRIF